MKHGVMPTKSAFTSNVSDDLVDKRFSSLRRVYKLAQLLFNYEFTDIPNFCSTIYGA